MDLDSALSKSETNPQSNGSMYRAYKQSSKYLQLAHTYIHCISNYGCKLCNDEYVIKYFHRWRRIVNTLMIIDGEYCSSKLNFNVLDAYHSLFFSFSKRNCTQQFITVFQISAHKAISKWNIKTWQENLSRSKE